MTGKGSPDWPDTIWVVGCGNMGGAILAAWLDAGLARDAVTVIDPAPSQLPEGVRCIGEVPAGAEAPDLLLLSVKPQMLGSVADALITSISGNTTIISILAGTRLDKLRAIFAKASEIVRVMPNMAVSIGKSPLLVVEDKMSGEIRTLVEKLFTPLGDIFWLAQESDIHLATALSGSGPAFLFRFIDALAQGARDLGMESGQAAALALKMTEGAALLAAQSADDPGTLADKVASPGGVTREGLNILDADDALNNLIREMLAAARDRDIEMEKI